MEEKYRAIYNDIFVYGFYRELNNEHFIYDNDSVYTIDPKTLSKYTGLIDLNDIEIYGSIYVNNELTKGGDIIKYHSNLHRPQYMEDCIVLWNKYIGGFSFLLASGRYSPIFQSIKEISKNKLLYCEVKQKTTLQKIIRYYKKLFTNNII